MKRAALARALALVVASVVLGAVVPGAVSAARRSRPTPLCSPVGALPGVRVGVLARRGDVHLSRGAYTVGEASGTLWITLQRSDPAGLEQVRYGVRPGTARSPLDFRIVPNSVATLLPGQTACRFPVRIRNNGMNAPPVAAEAYLFGSAEARLSAPSSARVTILRDDPLGTRDPGNPLELRPAPTDGDPLSGARFFVSGSASPAGEALRALAGAPAPEATALRFLADEPQGYRFWFWNQPHPAGRVAHYLQDAEAAEPGTVVELSTYSLVHGACDATANAGFTPRYLDWIRGLARGIGNFRVVLFFELDSLITSPCLSPAQRHIRLAEQLWPAIRILERDPHLVLYLDAGASDALSPARAAADLRAAGVGHAQGFVLNATHFQWDTTEIRYGQAISRRLGGHTHFLVDSAANGRGPLLNPHGRGGVEDLCNPPGRGLGTLSTETGYTNLDGLLWFSPPGVSGGTCGRGDPATAVFWPAYAAALYALRDFAVSGPRLPLARSGRYVPYGPALRP